LAQGDTGKAGRYAEGVRCYFLRHGIAAEPDAWTGSDYDRPLTREGRERMAREARAIGELGFDFELIVTSPLVRARETAEILADRLAMRDRVVQDPRLGGGFNQERLAAMLGERPTVQSIVLVGHEPTMSATIGRVIGNASIELKKAALAGIELFDPSAPHGTLICLIPPRVLAALGKR